MQHSASSALQRLRNVRLGTDPQSSTPIVPESSASSAHAGPPLQKRNFMKKTKDEMRAEYKRSDFTKLERGKLA